VIISIFMKWNPLRHGNREDKAPGCFYTYTEFTPGCNKNNIYFTSHPGATLSSRPQWRDLGDKHPDGFPLSHKKHKKKNPLLAEREFLVFYLINRSKLD
jgi:hypothetical protein